MVIPHLQDFLDSTQYKQSKQTVSVKTNTRLRRSAYAIIADIPSSVHVLRAPQCTDYVVFRDPVTGRQTPYHECPMDIIPLCILPYETLLLQSDDLEYVDVTVYSIPDNLPEWYQTWRVSDQIIVSDGKIQWGCE